MVSGTLKDLLVDELKDAYDAEHQITEALPKMIKAASSIQFKDTFEIYLEQTKDHIARLEYAFKLLNEKPARKTCTTMQRLLSEGENLIKQHKTSLLLDAELIGQIRRVEHYQIAVYGISRAYAETLGQTQIADIIQQTLNEEKEMGKLMRELSFVINQQYAEEMTITSAIKLINSIRQEHR